MDVTRHGAVIAVLAYPSHGRLSGSTSPMMVAFRSALALRTRPRSGTVRLATLAQGRLPVARQGAPQQKRKDGHPELLPGPAFASFNFVLEA